MLHPLVSSLSAESRRAVIGWACGIAFVMFAVYMSNGRTFGAGDTMPARYLPHTILHEGDTDFNEFTHLFEDGMPYYMLRCGGSYRSAFPPMAGLLALPVHAAAHLFPHPDTAASLEFQEKVAAALIAAWSAAFVFLAAREVCGGPASLVVALVYGLGTSTFSVSSQGLWQHGPIELFLALSAWLLLRGRRTGRLWPLGASLAMATLCRPTAAVAVLVIGVYVLATRWKQFPFYVLAGLPFVVFIAWYNSDYGHVLGPYYHIFCCPRGVIEQAGGLPESVGWWSGHMWAGMAGHLISPSRGLLIFSPVLVLGVHGAWRKLAVERDGAFLAMGLACLVHLLVISKFRLWWAGHSFGPRYCADVLPFAALFLIPMAQRLLDGWRSAASVAFVALAAISVGIHACGVYARGPGQWNTNPLIQDYPTRVWHWRDSQILAAFRKRPEIVPLDRLAPGGGLRERDPRATYGWCKRLDPKGSPTTISLERELKTGKDCLVTLRAKATGTGEAGELRAVALDGHVLARTPLTARPRDRCHYETFRLRFPLTGTERRMPFRCQIAVNANAHVLLDHLTIRRVKR